MRLLAALTFACVLFASRTAVADYDPLSFSRMVFDADVVVVGHIETLRETDYVFRVEEWLAGTPKSETLTIRRFEDWTCAQRLPKYAVGQRFVSFLERRDGALSTMSGGCEGDVVLEDGVVLMSRAGRWATRWSSLGGFGSRTPPLPAKQFVDAVRTLLTGHREIGAPGYVDAWRALLTNPDSLVVATAIDRLGRPADLDVNPEPGSAFAEVLVGAVANPDRDVRIYAALRIGRLLGPAEAYAASRRLAESSRTASAELRPAAALARVALRPGDPSCHVAMLRVLSDESVPSEERAAAAGVLDDSPVVKLGAEALKRVDPVARQAVVSVRDAVLLLRICAYLDDLHGRHEFPTPTDAEHERTKWLGLLPGVPVVETDADSEEPAPPVSPYLSAEERAVFVPRDAAERPRIARIVRAVRRGRNAERAHDATATLDAYRDALTAASGIGEATRLVVVELGVDLEEVGRTARDLDAARK